MISRIIILIALFIAQNGYANSLGRIPGIIPKDNSLAPASDLIYEGNVLLPHEALELKKSGIDLSELDPKSSDLWRSDDSRRLFNPKKLEIETDDEVEYLSPVLSRTGNFRFTGKFNGAEGVKTYTFMMSKTAHNVLLRAALLKKLGYTVPTIKHLAKVKVKFSSKLGVELFTNRLAEDTFGDPKRWVIDHPEEAKEIELQDVLVFDSEVLFYNLAIGYVPSHLIKGRRVLNSLLVPYALTNVPESVNMYSWHAGTVLSESIKMDYESSGEFSTSMDDAKWIVRSILKLKKNDFEDIAKAALVPTAVEKLLLEKMVSRRNTLCGLFEIKCNKIEFNEKVSYGKDLSKGKLLTLDYPGYASRFAYGDPESPLSSSEIFAFVKSKAISNIISNLMTKFNEKYMPHTDVAQKVIEQQTEKARENFINYLKTGQPQKTSFGIWAIPRFGTNFSVSRDIVAGSYLGTDNVVQLVDTIGVSVDAGAFIGTDGIPTPWIVSANAKGYINRRYSHLKPIKSMKKALKTPFRNVLVPWLKRDFGHILDPLMRGDLEELKDEEKQEHITKVMAEFNKQMEVGESLIVTDSIGGTFQVNAGYKFTEIVKAEASFFASQMIVSRLHIHRKAENLIQIYKDLGNMSSIGMSVGLKAKVPVLTIKFKKQKGHAKTKFYDFDINDNMAKNPDILKNVRAIRSLLLNNSFELINVLKKPYIVKHAFSETSKEGAFFFMRAKKQKQKDKIIVTHPKGSSKQFYRRQEGKRKGKNYEAMAIDILNALLDESEDNSIQIASANNGNPGDSFLGSSMTRSTSFVGEIEQGGNEVKGMIKKPFVNLSYVWKGWKTSLSKLKGILSKFNKKYDFDFYPEHILNTTQSLQLYQVTLSVYFYDTAIKHMISLSDEQVEAIFEEHGSYKVKKTLGGLLKKVAGGNKKHLKRLMKRFIKAKKKYLAAQAEFDLKSAAKYGVDLTSISENVLNLEGLLKLVGGKENIYIHSRVNGFRKGDESGDSPLISHSIGEIGGEYFQGPLQAMKNRLGMTESEFFVYWMLGKL